MKSSQSAEPLPASLRRIEPLVIIESPYNHALSEMRLRYNAYLKAAVLDSIERCEAPFASHGFYTQFLSDLIPSHRLIGMRLMRRFITLADYVAVYEDLGISRGMREGIRYAERLGLSIHFRKIGFADENSLPLQEGQRGSRRQRAPRT